MTKKIFKIIVELYELLFTARKDDRMGRVLSTGSLKIDDLIDIVVSRGTDINPLTIKASYEMLKEAAMEEVCKGKLVEFGLTHNRLSVNGVFIGDHAAWKADEHKLVLIAIPTAEMRHVIETVAVEVRGMAASGIHINTLTDAVSGEVNTRITPGGGIHLTGVKIKIAGNAPETGIRLTETTSEAVIQIPAASILVNEPSKVTLIVPPDVPRGDYRLSIATQYSPSSILLKEPRTYTFDCVLTCN